MPDAGYLTIGKVVKKLQPQYPDLSVSKVRFLEDEGLLEPSRTPGGYRLYSPADVRRLETILHLQKTRFLPLSVIKEELERESAVPEAALSAAVASQVSFDDAEVTSKFHTIDHLPDLLGVSVSFVRQLAENGVITMKRSPHGRDLVDGRDFALIRACEELRRYGIGPRNLRQYVQAANRESAMFEQALMVFTRKAGGVAMEVNDETRQQFSAALTQMLALTNQVRDALVSRQLRQSFTEMDSDKVARDNDHASERTLRRRSWSHR